MPSTPWLTSDDLSAAIQLKISLPLSQNTFSETDLLTFANEELSVAQVPSILEYHEEYFVTYTTIPLVVGQQNYPVPERAIGGKIRNIFYVDTNGNLIEMTRLSPDEKAYFQRTTSVTTNSIFQYYFEGNDIVLVPTLTTAVGSLRIDYYLRPNILVPNSSAAIISSFNQTITINNASISPNDSVTINGQVFTAVSSSPGTNQFLIDVSSIATASNLVSAINTNGITTASNVSGTSAVVTLTAIDKFLQVSTSNSSGFTIPTTSTVNFTSLSTTVYSNGMLVDFLQTKPGHKTLGMDVRIPLSGISGNSINFTTTSIPTTTLVGDYICPQYQCIIPQIPTDLHSGLAERAAARVLASIGDTEGLQVSNQKIQDIKHAEGALIDNRAEGNPLKITARHSLLRYGRIGGRRGL